MELRNNTIRPILALFKKQGTYRVFSSDYEAACFFGVTRETIWRNAKPNNEKFVKKVSAVEVILKYIDCDEAELISDIYEEDEYVETDE